MNVIFSTSGVGEPVRELARIKMDAIPGMGFPVQIDDYKGTVSFIRWMIRDGECVVEVEIDRD